MGGLLEPLDGPGHRLVVARRHEVGSHSPGDEAAEPLRVAGDQAEEDPTAEGEADGVHLALGREHGGHAGVQVGVGGRVVRLGRVAVAEQVDGDGLAAGVGQQVDPPGLPPVAFERRREAMHEENGLRPHRGSVLV